MRFVEPTKITASQITSGNQYLTNCRIRLQGVRRANVKIDGVSQKRPTKSANLKSAIHNPQSEVTAPLTFEPIFVERIWGGRRLQSEFQKKLPPQKRIGESWEIVDRPEAQSLVAQGPLRGRTLHDLWIEFRKEIFGKLPDAPRFPLLIKILDASKKLSLQVHPDENAARRLRSEPKTEFWYVAAAEPGAELFLGFRQPVARGQFEQKLRDGTGIDDVQRIPVHPGDSVFLPAGRVHAIGGGNLVIEIQQNSDTTYRLFDWNRTDPVTGKERELHIEQGLECIDFNDVQPTLIQAKDELLLSHSLFEIGKWNLNQSREAAPPGLFAIVCCLTGKLRCADVDLAAGEFFLIAAQAETRQLQPLAPQTSLLRITIPR